MLNREQIAEALKDRNITIVHQNTGISRPTLTKLRENRGSVWPSTTKHISEYLMRKPEGKDDTSV